MSYKVETIPNFDRELKRLTKKYASLKRKVAQLGEELVENPTKGISIGKDCYKIRLSIKSKGQIRWRTGNHLRGRCCRASVAHVDLRRVRTG